MFDSKVAKCYFFLKMDLLLLFSPLKRVGKQRPPTRGVGYDIVIVLETTRLKKELSCQE